MKALISPIECTYNGYRVAEVSQESFEVASPLFWIDCTDNILPDQFWFDPQDNTIKEVPKPVIVIEDSIDLTKNNQ